MSLTLNVKEFRALSLQAAVFSLSGVEVHVSVVPYAQNEGMYHVIHNKPGVFSSKFPHSPILHYAFSSWREKTMT